MRALAAIALTSLSLAACAGTPDSSARHDPPVLARPVTSVSYSLDADTAVDAAAPSPWPLDVPTTTARIADPGDGRTWVVVTQVDAQSTRITAAAQDGALAITLTHPRAGTPTCEAQLGALVHSDQIDVLRVDNPAAFRAPPWSPTPYLWHRPQQDLEFNCLRIGDTPWLATAVARPEQGVTLLDAAPMAQQLATALTGAALAPGYPVHLETSGLVLPDPRDDVRWSFLGRTPDFPLPADTIVFNPHAPGGVTLTVTVREGPCADAWDALRASLVTEGEIVDRPGYVPAAFGARIRRIGAGTLLREVYCMGSTRGAVLVTSVIGTTDGEAMTRAGPMLESIAAAAGGATPAASAPPGSTPARRGQASP